MSIFSHTVLKPNLPIQILGTGSALPKQTFSHFDLLKYHPEYASRPEETLNKLAKKSQTRFGFAQRHLVSPPFIPHSESNKSDNTTSEKLAILATQGALQTSTQCELEALIHGTTTTSRYTGSQAPAIVHALSSKAAAFEMKAGCSTSLAALHSAFGLLSLGYKNVMVSCAETLSKTISSSQLETLFLLADGASSIWLAHNKKTPHAIVKQALYHTDGKFINTYTTPGLLPPNEIDLANNNYTMQGDGSELRTQAKRRYQEMLDALFPDKKQLGNVTWIVPHQINRALIDEFLENNHISAKVQWDAEDVGNLGGTSVLYSLNKLLTSKQLKQGDEILLMSVGGGLSFAMQHWQWVENNEY